MTSLEQSRIDRLEKERRNLCQSIAEMKEQIATALDRLERLQAAIKKPA